MIKIIKPIFVICITFLNLNSLGQINNSIKNLDEEYWDNLRIEIYKDSSYNPSSDFQYYFNNGLKLLQKRDYQTASINFRRLLSILKHTKILQTDSSINKIPSPYLYIGICKAQVGEIDSAKYYFNNCIANKVSVIESYNELGIVYLYQRDIDSALICFNEGYKRDTKNLTTNYNLGYTYYLNGDFATAKKYLKQIIEQKSHFGIPFILLGHISTKLNNLPLANEYYTSAIKADPVSAAGYFYRGLNSLSQKEEALAYMDFMKVNELDSMNYQVYPLIASLDILSKRYELGISRLIKSLSKLKNKTKQQLDDFEDIEFLSLLNKLIKVDLSKEEKEFGYQCLKNALNNNWDANKELYNEFYSTNKRSLFAMQFYLLSLSKSKFIFSVEFCDKYIKKDSTLNMMLFIKSKILYEKKLYDQCVKYLSILIKQTDLYTCAYYYRGKAYNNTGNEKLALDDFTKIISIYPNYSEGYNERGCSYAKMKKDRDALKDFFNAIRINPNFYWPYYNASISYLNLGILDSAIYCDNISKVLINYYGESDYNQALYCKKYGNYEKALFYLNKIIEKYPNWMPALSLRGEISLELNNFKQAISDLSICIENHSLDIHKLHLKRGTAYYRINEFDKSLSDFLWLYSKDSNNINTIISVGDCYQAKDDFPNALKYYDLALNKDSTISVVYYQKGRCFSKTNNSEQALRYFEKSLKIDPEFSFTFKHLAREYYKLGNFDKCIFFSQKAFEFNQIDINAMFYIALSNLRLNQYEVAKKQYKQYMKLCIKQGVEIDTETIKNLKDLIKNGIKVNESKKILKEIFNIDEKNHLTQNK